MMQGRDSRLFGAREAKIESRCEDSLEPKRAIPLRLTRIDRAWLVCLVSATALSAVVPQLFVWFDFNDNDPWTVWIAVSSAPLTLLTLWYADSESRRWQKLAGLALTTVATCLIPYAYLVASPQTLYLSLTCGTIWTINSAMLLGCSDGLRRLGALPLRPTPPSRPISIANLLTAVIALAVGFSLLRHYLIQLFGGINLHAMIFYPANFTMPLAVCVLTHLSLPALMIWANTKRGGRAATLLFGTIAVGAVFMIPTFDFLAQYFDFAWMHVALLTITWMVFPPRLEAEFVSTSACNSLEREM